MLKIIFWISVSLIIYTYFGYPLILWILSIFLSRPVKKEKITPSVSLIISAYNEEKAIEQKIKSCLELDYPEDKMEILIGSDGSTDSTNEIVNRYICGKLKFYKWEKRRGKPSVLNDLVSQAKGEVIVFTDARQILEKEALRGLVSNFTDKNVGCVSGELILTGENESSVGEELGLYWKYEKFLRKRESQIGSMIGATGPFYAIRRNLYIPLPSDILLDDVFIPMTIVQQGYRAGYESLARAYDKVSVSSKQELRRKIRTLTGNWQLFSQMKSMFNPLKSKIAFQLFSHKFLRVLIPYFLVIVFVSNMFLIRIPTYKVFFILQLLFYSFAMIGLLLPGRKIRLFNIPHTFCMLNLAAVKGLYSFATNKQKVTWKE